MIVAILWIISSFLNYLIIATILDGIFMGFPIPQFSKNNYPPKYLIKKENRIDIQTKFKCAAYSSAYVMRYFGMEANGDDLYKVIPNKMKNGYVYPKGILKLMQQKGFSCSYRKGNIAQLKQSISKGAPVIVHIKIYNNQKWLHFVPVVGYDEENFYIAESLSELVNANNEHYNRIVPINEFEMLWNIRAMKMPLYRNTYICFENKIDFTPHNCTSTRAHDRSL